jgi:hypothetical protein
MRRFAPAVVASLAIFCLGCEEGSFPETEITSQAHAGPAIAGPAAVSQTAVVQDAAAQQEAEQTADAPTTPAATAPAASALAATSPASSQPLPPAPAEDKSKLPTLRLTFDDLKFEMEKGGEFKRSMITPKIEGYVGRKIKIAGYIYPTFLQSGITQFVLVRDNMECCFGPGAALYDCINVVMMPGKSIDYSTRPVTVEGVFKLQEMLDFDGVVRAIYHLDGIAVN